MSYIVLRGRWCNIIVLNAHAPTGEISDDSKDSFYEELEQVFNHFSKYHIKILLGDFNAKLGREDTVKPTIGNESLHQDSNDIGVKSSKLCHIKTRRDVTLARCQAGTYQSSRGGGNTLYKPNQKTCWSCPVTQLLIEYTIKTFPLTFDFKAISYKHEEYGRSYFLCIRICFC
jgi:hypothetical protein